MDTNWNEFVEIYDWEFDLLNSEQKGDVDMWLHLCHQYGLLCLKSELGLEEYLPICQKNGIEITALDNAPAFIDRIRSLDLPDPINAILGDMRDFKLEKKFTFCFFSYTTFQYLLTLREQRVCLKNILEVLTPNGVVGFDLDPSICDLPDINTEILLYKEYNPEKKCYISMSTNHKVDRERQITCWEDRYRFHSEQKKVFKHKLCLKGITLIEMQCLLVECGFSISHVYGDFQFSTFTEKSNRLIIIARANF